MSSSACRDNATNGQPGFPSTTMSGYARVQFAGTHQRPKDFLKVLLFLCSSTTWRRFLRSGYMAGPPICHERARTASQAAERRFQIQYPESGHRTLHPGMACSNFPCPAQVQNDFTRVGSVDVFGELGLFSTRSFALIK